jgi:hypothetical protein
LVPRPCRDGDFGDPALSFALPVERYRQDYTLLVPSEYDANLFAITVAAGGLAMLDGIEITGQLRCVPRGRVPVGPGQHHLVCPQTCGVEAPRRSRAGARARARLTRTWTARIRILWSMH